MRGLNICGTIADHCGASVNSILRDQTFQLPVLLDTDVATVHELEKVANREVLQYSLGKVDSLRRTDTQKAASPDQVAQSFRYAGIQDILGVADVRISLPEPRYELHDAVFFSRRGESTERNIDRRTYVIGHVVFRYQIESECSQGVVHRTGNAESRVAYGPVEIKNQVTAVHAACQPGSGIAGAAPRNHSVCSSNLNVSLPERRVQTVLL